MKGLTFKRISILSLVLLAASAATAFITKEKKDPGDNGVLVGAPDTNDGNTCRTLVDGDEADCVDTQVSGGANSSSAGGVSGTSTGVNNTTGLHN